MKPYTFNKLNPAGLILAALAGIGRFTVDESTRCRLPDPERQAAAEAKRLFRRQRNLYIKSRGGYRE